jgi:hypothetical protein
MENVEGANLAIGVQLCGAGTHGFLCPGIRLSGFLTFRRDKHRGLCGLAPKKKILIWDIQVPKPRRLADDQPMGGDSTNNSKRDANASTFPLPVVKHNAEHF